MLALKLRSVQSLRKVRFEEHLSLRKGVQPKPPRPSPLPDCVLRIARPELSKRSRDRIDVSLGWAVYTDAPGNLNAIEERQVFEVFCWLEVKFLAQHKLKRFFSRMLFIVCFEVRILLSSQIPATVPQFLVQAPHFGPHLLHR